MVRAKDSHGEGDKQRAKDYRPVDAVLLPKITSENCRETDYQHANSREVRPENLSRRERHSRRQQSERTRNHRDTPLLLLISPIVVVGSITALGDLCITTLKAPRDPCRFRQYSRRFHQGSTEGTELFGSVSV